MTNESAAAYAISPHIIGPGQYRVAEGGPLSNFDSKVLEVLRSEMSQAPDFSRPAEHLWVGHMAILRLVGFGTPGELHDALERLAARGLIVCSEDAALRVEARAEAICNLAGKDPNDEAVWGEALNEARQAARDEEGIRISRPELVQIEAALEGAEQTLAMIDAPETVDAIRVALSLLNEKALAQ